MTTFSVINPATGATIARLPIDGPASVAGKYAAARAAQPLWAAQPLATRLGIIKLFRSALVREKAPLAEILTSEVGKPIKQSLGELDGVLRRIDFFLKQSARVLKPETVLDDRAHGLTEAITHEPLGVIANISAWNYPYFVGSNVFIPALLAGNAVLYKPSEYASLTGQAIARLLHASGVPADIFGLVLGPGPVGATLVRQPVDGVFFTGSYATGARIAALTAGRMLRVQLELGGKDPIYVCDDAAIGTAAGIADGAFYNAGQSCCSVERIYVHQKIFRPFVAAFVAEVKKFRLGDPLDPATYIGPLARPAQIKVLEAQVKDALARGAKLLTGGAAVPGRPGYFAPTVLTNVSHEMAVMRDESFGPIIGIMAVPDDETAIALMNDTEYGLTAGVYSPDQARARRILQRVHCGSAYWNCCDRVSPALPWSGVGKSGVGVTLSKYGIQTFTRPKAWHLRRA
jgi:acyl-CoA reductase-like NAD-dependent aldehyde dehydrogenase